MKYVNRTMGLEFDDVLIKPITSDVVSRDDVDISVKLSNTFTLKFPLVASPMVGVTNGNFLSKLSDLGGLGFTHRFYARDLELYSELDRLDDKNYGVAVYLNQNFSYILDHYHPKIILVDIANGYITSLYRYCETIASYISNNKLDVLLMAGNVVTPEGVRNLSNCGCNLARFGIGGGSNCSTRNVTGISIPTLSALLDCGRFNLPNQPIKIVVDGGIKSSGDFVKSIVGGASLCMSGRLFAETNEAPNAGKLYGMASRTHQNNMGYNVKSIEGFDTNVEKKYSLANFVKEFSYGVKSAGTYLNAKDLNEMYYNGGFTLASKYSIKEL